MKISNVILVVMSLAINLMTVYFLKLKTTLREVLEIHVFLAVLFFLTDLIQTKLSRHKNAAPLLLLSINFLRILACIFFLLPAILSNGKLESNYIYNFFAVYFFILFSDIFLKRKNSNKINR